MESPKYKIPFEKIPLVQLHPWKKWWNKEDSTNLYAQNLDILFDESAIIYVTKMQSKGSFLFEEEISKLAKNKNIIINNKELQYIINLLKLSNLFTQPFE